MDPTIVINERVDVVAVFRKRGDAVSLVMPYKMRWRDRDIALTELGLRHPTKAGRRMIHVFDVSDGVNDYRLEFDAEMLTWMLVSVIGGQR